MKVIWHEEEYWPVYEIIESDGSWPKNEIDIPVELVERYATAMKEFWAVQMEIRKVVGE